ncbi:hypothetical protein I4F81_000721 [Pyropia yezoensis]|uniref:Uncharacterized protein n=1 Tax=Pyropia yezoensis TaxID=2788 RepID=A0ACC3BKH5_PYRYE|nr:hypothetical protein I4F81_000721 [Neopyropia yezoensis]|eukprot:contig_15997_g3840
MPERRRRGQDPVDAAEAHCLSGNVAFHRRDWPAAIRCYTAAIRVRSSAGLPSDRRLMSNRSAAWLARAEDVVQVAGGEDVDDHPPGGVGVAACLAHAARDAARCVKVDPAWPKGWFRLHSVFLAAGNEAEAAEALHRGLANCPPDEDLRRALERLERGMVVARAKPAVTSSLAAAESCKAPVDRTCVVESGCSVVSRSSSSDDALSGSLTSPAEQLRDVGRVRFLAEDWDGAIEAFTEAVAVAARARLPADADALSARSAAYLRKGLDAADDVVKGGIHCAMAAACLDRATSDAKTCVAVKPDWADGWLRLGAAYAARELSDLAAETYHRGLASCPDNIDLKRAHEVAVQCLKGEQTAKGRTEWTRQPDEDGHATEADTEASPLGQSTVKPLPTTPHQQLYEDQDDLPRANESQMPRTMSTTSSPLTQSSPASSLGGLDPGEDHEDEASESCSDAARSHASDSFSSGWFGRRRSSARVRARHDRTVPAPAPLAGFAPGEDDGTSAASDDSGHRPAVERRPVDTSMYDVLGVTHNASPAAIRRAYYVAAKQVHPDRNLNDPEATAKFQELAEAYQILSDPDSRAQYDAHGTVDGEGVLTTDPATLFTVVFGGDQFKAYTGELQVTAQAANADADGNPPDEATLTRIQTERVEALANQLTELIQPWVDGDHDTFRAWADAEASRLVEVNFGAAMLHTIGYVYVHTAAMALDGRLPRLLTAGRYTSHRQAAQRRAHRAAERLLESQAKMRSRLAAARANGTPLSEEEARAASLAMTETAIAMFWKLTVTDVHDTLDAAARRVLEGVDLPADAEMQVAGEAALADPWASGSDRRPQGGAARRSRGAASVHDGPADRPADQSAPRPWAERSANAPSEAARRRFSSGATDAGCRPFPAAATRADAPGCGPRGMPGRTAGRSIKGLLRGKSGLPNGVAATTRAEVLVERARAVRLLGKVFMNPQ